MDIFCCGFQDKTITGHGTKYGQRVRLFYYKSMKIMEIMVMGEKVNLGGRWGMVGGEGIQKKRGAKPRISWGKTKKKGGGQT